MKKKFTTLQLFNVVDGRISTGMDDIYDILNHVCDESLMTHHLSVACRYLELKNPKWLQEEQSNLRAMGNLFYTPVLPSGDSTFTYKDIPFADFIATVKKMSVTVEIPQLKDEFDTSDFATFMVENSVLARKR